MQSGMLGLDGCLSDCLPSAATTLPPSQAERCERSVGAMTAATF